MSIRSFFGFGKGRKSQSQSSKRALRMEALEERALLSAAPLSTSEYADLCDQYAEFNLPANMNDLNVITLDLAQGDGLSQLKSAISTAGTTTKSDLIVVRTSNTANTLTYTAAEDKLLIDIDSSQYGSITIVGLGTKSLTLNANQKCNGISVGKYLNIPTNVNLGGLTITGGNDSYGGGINNRGTLTVANSTISGNIITFSGGGIYNYYGTVTVTNCTISENSSTMSTGGGGIHNDYGTVTVTNSTISGNTARMYGGGINNEDGTVMVTNSTISGNTVETGYGGGIYNGGTLTVTNSTILENTGGGISNYEICTITNSTISGNTAGVNGGGIRNSSGTMTITNSEISGNTVSGTYASGGGIYTSYAATLTITNSKISGNTTASGTNSTGASSCGGGIYVAGHNNYSATITVTNSTISGNTASTSSSLGGYSCGGGIYIDGYNATAKVYNTIVACNTASSNKDIYCAQSGFVYGYNCLTSYTEWDNGNNNIVYNSSMPLFIDATNGDYHLASGSQAIDKGNNAYAVDSQGIALACDFDGFPRIVNNTVDIGAYEFQGALKLPSPSLSASSNGSNSISVNIGNVANASGYTVQYSKYSNFTSPTAVIFQSSGYHSINNLDANTTYYVRVKANGTGNYSDSNYSAYSTVITNSQTSQLTALTLSTTSPKVGEAITASVSPSAATCTYQWSYSSSPSGTFYNISGATSASYTPTSTYNGKYLKCTVTGTGNYSGVVSAVTTNTVAQAVDNVGDSISNAKDIAFTNDAYTFTDKLGEGTYDLKDVDIYKFYVSASDINRSYTFTTSQPSGGTSVDTYIRLFDSTGNELVYDDDSGTDYRYSSLTWTPPSSGTYYLGVSSYSNRVYDPAIAGSATSDGSAGDYTLTIVRTGTVKLLTPTLSVSSTTSDSITVYVGIVANASEFNLQYSTDPNFTNPNNQTASTGSNTIYGLEAGQTYYIRVMALGSGNYTNSNYSAVKTANTSQPTGKLSAPTFSVSEIDSNSVSVTVARVANASGYTLEYSDNSSFINSKYQSVQVGANTINDLNDNTRYYFRIKALGTGNYADSDYSAVKSVFINNEQETGDVASLRGFLEQTDSNGVKNGTKINSAYNANDTSTWTGVTWSEIDGVMRVTEIDWCEKELTGVLDLSGFIALEDLFCPINQLTAIDVSGCTSLTSLWCGSNQLTELDVSNNLALNSLNCYNNQISSLDVSNNLNLGFLECGSNQLTSLDVSVNTALWQLNCDCNQLSSLNVSNNINLTQLRCGGNQLTVLDVSKNTELWHLDCRDNYLTQLDLSNNSQLMEIYCSYNYLTSLDVTKNPELKWFGCSGNQLAMLDVSKNPELSSLSCWNSNLRSVIINPAAEDVSIYLDSYRWTFLDFNGNTLADNEYSYVYNASDSIPLPITAVNSHDDQTILFTDHLEEEEVNARIVFQDSLKDADTAAELPEGITSILAGKTVYAEIWVKDIEDADPAIIGGYVNMLYDSDALSVLDVTYGTVFCYMTGFQTYESGEIATIGGTTAPSVLDKGDDEWVRLATVSFVADMEGFTTVSLGAPNDYHDNLTRTDGRILSNAQIDYGSSVLEITAACPMDIDGDGYIGVSDYSLLSKAWRSSPGKENWDPTCDIDGDGYVGVSDYTFLSKNWRKYADDPDLVYPEPNASPATAVSEDNFFEMNNMVALEANETANVRLTAVSTKTASDTADEVPASLTEINPGDSFFVEIWVRNFSGYEGANLCGLTGGYLNMSYPEELLNLGDVTYGRVFSQLNNLQDDSQAGFIDLIGGVAGTGVLDKGDDEWVRLATVSFTASENGDALIESLPPTDSHDNLTLTSGKTLKNDEISFGVINLKIGSTVIQLKVNNDFVKTTLNNSVVIDYRENDAVADWSKTTVEFGDASNGEYSVNGNGTITYTPEDGFYGTDAVSYVVVDSSGELSTGAIVISVGLPIATSVQKTSGSHSPSSAMAASVERLTDWDNCCVELWAQDVNALNPGETTFTLSYNPTIYNAPYFSACADGVALSVTDSAALPDGSVEVQLTARVLESLSSQTDNLFLGTVVLTPSMDDGAGVVAPLAAEPVCALDGSETPTTVEAMPYDLIRNGSVDVNDFVAFATVFGYVPGNMSPINPLYVQTAKSDFNKDGSVNADDFVLFAINFGATKNTADKPAPLASAATELVRSEVFENAELIESQPELKSSLTLRDAYSAALLDLYDNQDVADLSGSSDVLAKSRLDAQLFDVESDSSHKASSQAIDAVLEEDLLAIDWN